MPRAVTGDRLLQKSWDERSWEATCPDSRWGWLEPQEDAGGPQVGLSPQCLAVESAGEAGVTGRPVRGGAGGPASRRAPSAWITTTSTYLHFLEQVERPLRMLGAGGERRQGPPLASSHVNPWGLMGHTVASCEIGRPSQAGSLGIRRGPSGWISSFRMEPGLGNLLQVQRSKLVAFSSLFAPSSAWNQVGGRLQMPF